MRPVGKGALREAAVTSSEAKQKCGKDAAHETKYRIMPVSRSVVEVRLNISSALLPQATILILNLLGLMVKTAFAGSSMYFWPVDLAFRLISSLCSGESLVMVLVSVKLSSSVLPTPIHFLRVSPVLRRTSSAVTDYMRRALSS